MYGSRPTKISDRLCCLEVQEEKTRRIAGRQQWSFNQCPTLIHIATDLPRLIFSATDRQQTRPARTDVEINFRDMAAVHEKL